MKKLLLSIIPFMFLSLASFAQQLSDTVQLSEVTVSVEKHQQKAVSIPSSISTLNAKTVENRKINDLRDASAMTPNFYMPEYGSKLTAPVYIRGVGSRINNPTIGLYVDGIPYFEKSMFAFDFNDIQQIEILRGPQGTLYGRNTLGGIINIQTRRPGRQMDTRFSADFGNYGEQIYRFSYNQPVNNWLAILVDAGYSEKGGYYTNMFDNRSVGSDLVKNGSLKIRATPLKNLVLDYKISGERSNERGYPYGILDSKTGLKDINYNRSSLYDRDIAESSLTANYFLNHVTFTSISSYQYFKDNQDVDQDFLPQDIFIAGQKIKQSLYSQELLVSVKDWHRLEFVGGAFGFVQDPLRNISVRYGDSSKVFSSKLVPGSGYDKINDEQNSGIAFFGQATWQPFKSLFLTAGLRYDYEDNRLGYQNLLASQYTVLNKTRDTTFNTSYKQFMPKFSVRYEVFRDFSVYLTAAKGYRGGGFNTSFVQPKDQMYGPESLWSYEAGLKGNILSGIIFASADVFYIDWSNQQVSQKVMIGKGTTYVSGGNMYVNAGKTSSKGFELEMTVRPFIGLSFGGNYGLSIARYEDFRPVRYDSLNYERYDVNYKGNYLPFVPRYTYAGFVSYEKTLKSPVIKTVQATVSLQGVGKQYWDDENKQSQNPYSLLNASVGAGFRYFRLMLWAKNLMNTRFYPYRFYIDNFKNWYAQEGAPFTFGLTASIEINSRH